MKPENSTKTVSKALLRMLYNALIRLDFASSRSQDPRASFRIPMPSALRWVLQADTKMRDYTIQLLSVQQCLRSIHHISLFSISEDWNRQGTMDSQAECQAAIVTIVTATTQKACMYDSLPASASQASALSRTLQLHTSKASKWVRIDASIGRVARLRKVFAHVSALPDT